MDIKEYVVWYQTQETGTGIWSWNKIHTYAKSHEDAASNVVAPLKLEDGWELREVEVYRAKRGRGYYVQPDLWRIRPKP